MEIYKHDKFIMYNYNDYRLYLEHSWGKKPEQKAAEKAYNQKYYEENKSKWKQYRENAAKKFSDFAGVTAKNERDKYNELAENARNRRDALLDEENMAREHHDQLIDDSNRSYNAADEYGYLTRNNPFDSNDERRKADAGKVRDYFRKRGNEQWNAAQRATARANTKSTEATLMSKQAGRMASKAREKQKEYSKTPLGKVEGAVSKGKSFISNLIKKK